MALYFPPGPTVGQEYVGINGITYTWTGDRWASEIALEQGRAAYYIDNGDAFFQYDPAQNDELDGGAAS